MAIQALPISQTGTRARLTLSPHAPTTLASYLSLNIPFQSFLLFFCHIWTSLLLTLPIRCQLKCHTLANQLPLPLYVSHSSLATQNYLFHLFAYLLMLLLYRYKISSFCVLIPCLQPLVHRDTHGLFKKKISVFILFYYFYILFYYF